MIALSLMLAAAASASAADKDEAMSAKETRQLVHDYGKCIVKRQQRRASEAILANADNWALLGKYKKLIDGNCLTRPFATVQATFQGDQYRYALADALVRKELANVPAPDLTAVPRLDHRDPGGPPLAVDEKGKPLGSKELEELMAGYRRAQAFTYLSRYGECVVRLDPAAARGLLLTDPDTAEESRQFTALGEALGTCVPEGEKMSFGKLALRGTIAVNYYRLAMAATAPATTAQETAK